MKDFSGFNDIYLYHKHKIPFSLFLKLEDIGDDIEKIRIGHDDSGFAAGWFLSNVEVRKLNTSGNVNISKTNFFFNVLSNFSLFTFFLLHFHLFSFCFLLTFSFLLFFFSFLNSFPFISYLLSFSLTLFCNSFLISFSFF